MIKLKSLLIENNKIFVPRRSPEDRAANYNVVIQKQIQQYIKDGSKNDLDLSSAPITKLPDNLKKVGGSLDLGWSQITSLPDGLVVDGNIFLAGSLIKSLPNGLKVGGYLYLSRVPITALPDGLRVGGYLDISHTKIAELPHNLYVGECVFMGDTPLSRKYNRAEIKLMAPGIKGDIRK